MIRDRLPSHPHPWISSPPLAYPFEPTAPLLIQEQGLNKGFFNFWWLADAGSRTGSGPGHNLSAGRLPTLECRLLDRDVVPSSPFFLFLHLQRAPSEIDGSIFVWPKLYASCIVYLTVKSDTSRRFWLFWTSKTTLFHVKSLNPRNCIILI